MGDYGPPPGLCFDYFCQDTDNDPVQADRRLEDYNLDKKVQRLLDYAHWQASVTKGDEETMNIMFYLGSDFQYEAANEWFESLDILIDAVNSLPNSTVRAMYSTPSLYTYARNAEGLTWQVKKDDFFPYGISANAYRTGFYTSRPALKRYVRELSHRLQVARQLEVFSGGDGAATRALWEAMGVVQHHDAVSGTERQHVAYNYAYLLAKGAVSSDQLIAQSLAKLSTLKGSPLPFAQCPQANVSLCQTTQTGEPTAILVYNSQSRNQSFVVRFPVNASSGSVYDANGQLATNFALYPLQPTEATAVGGAEYEVLVEVEVPAMGWSTLFWQAGQADGELQAEAESRHSRMRTMMRASTAAADQTSDSVDNVSQYGAGRWRLQFDGSNGLLESVLDTRTNTTIPLKQEFLYYNSMQVRPHNTLTGTARPLTQHIAADVATPACLLTDTVHSLTAGFDTGQWTEQRRLHLPTSRAARLPRHERQLDSDRHGRFVRIVHVATVRSMAEADHSYVLDTRLYHVRLDDRSHTGRRRTREGGCYALYYGYC